ncbi:MAG: YceI family protein [Bdellovibrionaceae bacterium]|nr:YceI family protein [Pseudobdellovibrionaceae bacterium]
MKKAFLTSVVLAFALTAHANKKKAETPLTLNVDAAASEMKWVGSKITGSSHSGTVKIKSGRVEMKGNEILGGIFEIDMTSVTNTDLADSPKDMQKLVGHLLSDDFFSAKKFPTATFVIKSAKAVQNGPFTHEITGDLTIKGVTQSVTFPAVINSKGEMAEATASFEIDRTKWGIRYGSGQFFKNLGDRTINDQIKFDLKVVAKK